MSEHLNPLVTSPRHLANNVGNVTIAAYGELKCLLTSDSRRVYMTAYKLSLSQV